MTAQQAFQFFGQRSTAMDLAMNLPFLLVYVLAGDFAILRLLRHYPVGDGWMITVIMIVLASLAFGLAGLLVGQQWSMLAESIRIGTTHLSNRAFRLPVSKYPNEVFVLAVALFLGIAAVRYCTKRNAAAGG